MPSLANPALACARRVLRPIFRCHVLATILYATIGQKAALLLDRNEYERRLAPLFNTALANARLVL